MKARWQINVSRPVLARNRAQDRNDPPIIVRDYRNDAQPYQMAQRVDVMIDGQIVASVVHDANSVWVETDHALQLTDPKPGLDQ